MSVSADYTQPVAVNGYLCWNCNQVAEAKKGVDPAAASASADGVPSPSPAVQFGGALAGLPGASGASGTPPQANNARALDIFA